MRDWWKADSGKCDDRVQSTLQADEMDSPSRLRSHAKGIQRVGTMRFRLLNSKSECFTACATRTAAAARNVVTMCKERCIGLERSAALSFWIWTLQRACNRTPVGGVNRFSYAWTTPIPSRLRNRSGIPRTITLVKAANLGMLVKHTKQSPNNQTDTQRHTCVVIPSR